MIRASRVDGQAEVHAHVVKEVTFDGQESAFDGNLNRTILAKFGQKRLDFLVHGIGLRDQKHLLEVVQRAVGVWIGELPGLRLNDVHDFDFKRLSGLPWNPRATLCLCHHRPRRSG